MMRIPRIYADTSVIGGCLDIEFSHESSHFIEMVRKGKCVLLLSEITIAELDKAPAASSKYPLVFTGRSGGKGRDYRRDSRIAE